MYLTSMELSKAGMKAELEFDETDFSFFYLRKLRHHHYGTYLHSIRVSALCADLFQAFGYDAEERNVLTRSALLHDIGKLRIDSHLLDKQGFLSREEWNAIKTHCTNGEEILNQPCIRDSIDLEMIRYHHENLDGTGYYGIKADKLSLAVKIIRVADSFDAMTQPRSYKKTLCNGSAFEELYRWSDIHFDPIVVDELYRLKNHA